MTSERFRSRVALAAAVALHAILVALVAREPNEKTRAPSVPGERLVWVDPPLDRPFGDGPVEGTSRSGPVALGRTPTLPRGDGADMAGADESAIFEWPSGPSDDARTPGLDAPGAPRSQRLSLDELGIGSNPFLGDTARTIAEPPPAARGIRRSLANAIAKSDQTRGLGPEGPVLIRLEQETRGSDAPANSTALFRATTDAQGRLIGFDLLEASVGAREYRLLAERVLASLRSQRLRIPRGVRGVTMDLRVVSHVELPSGRDPGLGVDLLGMPLKKQGGEKSPRISILRIDPKGYKIELPNGDTLALPSFPLASQLEIDGDPVDLGAKAQRMVRAHLEHFSVEAADTPDSSLE